MVELRGSARFAAHARHFFACFLFLPAPQVTENHQHPRFDYVRIVSQRTLECRFRFFEIIRPAQAFEHPIHMTSAQAVIG